MAQQLQYHVAWWNCENMFDADTAPRTPELLRNLGPELVGWTAEMRDRKIRNLAQVISAMNEGRGPDILGVCEVENKHVLELLVAVLGETGARRHYAIAHADSQDKRGIDVAFLYDGSKFTAELQFSLQLVKRSSTRDLFQVNFRSNVSGRPFILIGNHWPSRREGQLESEPYRCMAGETLSYWISRIREIVGVDAAVMCVGDFNDEPFNRSLVDFALSCRLADRVIRSRDSPLLYNLMWPLLGRRLGSYYHDEPNMLDQILVTRGFLVPTSPWSVLEDTVRLESEHMMDRRSPIARPSRMGRPSKHGFYASGFSDHFPVSVRIAETLPSP